MTATKLLRDIQHLRKKHTLAFMAADYVAMGNVDTRIKLVWENYNQLCHELAEVKLCFNCSAKADLGQSLYSPASERPGKDAVLFCSARCRREYGIELGLT